MKSQKFHQGDVQAVETTLPKNCKPIQKKPIAFGEKHGHQHIITGDYEMYEDEKSNIYVTVGINGAVLQHIHQSNFVGFDSMEVKPKADHHPIQLKPNSTWCFGIHKKYNPFSKIWEKVID